MFCLWYGAATMTFITMVIVNSGLTAATLYCYMKAGIIDSERFRRDLSESVPNSDRPYCFGLHNST